MDRALYLASLQAELKQAEWCGETRRAAHLKSQITRLSAGTQQSPARETTAARRPARSKTT